MKIYLTILWDTKLSQKKDCNDYLEKAAKTLIEANGFKIDSVEHEGSKSLAYRINGRDRALYDLYTISGDGDIAELLKLKPEFSHLEDDGATGFTVANVSVCWEGGKHE